jgi:hypothetical protein
VGLEIGNQAVAYPFSTLAEVGVVNDLVQERPVAVFYAPDTLSALDAPTITESRAIGSGVPYSPLVEGERLFFEVRDGQITDTSTGSQWGITGHAISGPLEGAELEVLPHANHFWFAFSAFYEDVLIWDRDIQQE